jgi:hypothetical protein
MGATGATEKGVGREMGWFWGVVAMVAMASEVATARLVVAALSGRCGAVVYSFLLATG